MKRDISQKLTKQQGVWLEHIRQCQASGEPLSTYAARHDLSRQGIYRWKRRLQAMGALPPSDGRRGSRRDLSRGRPSAQRQGFVTARLSPEEAVAPSVRIHFRNGVVLEVGSSAVGRLQTDLLTQLAALP